MASFWRAYWDECVLFVTLYCPVVGAHLLVFYAAALGGSSGFVGFAARMMSWAFPLGAAVPPPLRPWLFFALVLPGAWAAHLWTARVLAGRTLALCLRSNAEREYGAAALTALRAVTFGAFVLPTKPCSVRRARLTLLACWLAIEWMADLATGVAFGGV